VFDKCLGDNLAIRRALDNSGRSDKSIVIELNRRGYRISASTFSRYVSSDNQLWDRRLLGLLVDILHLRKMDSLLKPQRIANYDEQSAQRHLGYRITEEFAVYQKVDEWNADQLLQAKMRIKGRCMFHNCRLHEQTLGDAVDNLRHGVATWPEIDEALMMCDQYDDDNHVELCPLEEQRFALSHFLFFPGDDYLRQWRLRLRELYPDLSCPRQARVLAEIIAGVQGSIISYHRELAEDVIAKKKLATSLRHEKIKKHANSLRSLPTTREELETWQRDLVVADTAYCGR
jgi:hypothetical protein